MVRFFNLLQRNLPLVIGIYLLIQFIYVIFFPVQYLSDSAYYYRLAEDCLRYNSFYPAKIHLYENYIVAPLYINLLLIILSVYNSLLSIGIMNIILNCIQLLLLFRISETLFDRNTANLTAVLYVLYLNTLGMVITNYTELLFGVLVLASVYFFLKKSKYSFFLSGIFAAASIGVRPLGWALVAAYILIFVFRIYKKRKLSGSFFQSVLGTALFIILFGLFNLGHFGRFIFTSTSGPVNLLIGANDDATGSYKELSEAEGSPGFIPESGKKTYFEKGEIWERRAFSWIKSNPIRWISLFPAKLGYVFLLDDFAISPLMNMQNWDLYHIIKFLKTNNGFKGIMSGTGTLEKFIYLTLQTLHYIYYVLLSIYIIAGILLIKKMRGFNAENFLPVLFCLTGIMIILIAHGIPRFKYPFLIILIPFAAAFIKEKIEKKIV